MSGTVTRELMGGRIVVAKRGTYCEATVPASYYHPAHACENKNGLRKVGRATFCWMHPTKAKAKP